ncbi:hypothetical protein [Paenibacillus violae]|uniref:hypothetical protein n=1 Tax=Paenibacillus TaxID=44249 RepID=UPI0028FC2534|nr:hypothetical protein [Paenibacillus sp. PFR10]
MRIERENDDEFRLDYLAFDCNHHGFGDHINNALTIGVTVVLETLSFTATSSSTSTTNNLVVTTVIHSI